MKHGVIIGNCQVQPLRHILGLFCSDMTFETFGIHLIPPAKRVQEISSFIERSRNNYDLIISAPLSNAFLDLDVARISETFSPHPVIIIPNFVFSGLHPDATYIGDLGERILGPLGEYHSKIAIISFLRNRSVADTCLLYRKEVFLALGYFLEFDKSMSALALREQAVQIAFSSELRELLTEDVCFFTFNHPTSFLFGHFCNKVATWLEERGLARKAQWSARPSCLPNHLMSSQILPIFPEIAEAHGLQFPGSRLYKPADSANGPATIDLQTFIEGEFANFSTVGAERLMQSAQVKSLHAKFVDYV